MENVEHFGTLTEAHLIRINVPTVEKNQGCTIW